MGKILVFIYDEIADFEMTFATHLLAMGCEKELVPIAYEDKIIKSSSGILYKPVKLVKDVLNEEVDGIFIPGGLNSEIREELLVLIRRLFKEDKLVAAICAAPRMLAKAGILDGIKFTTSVAAWTEEIAKIFNEKENPFPMQNYVEQRVVRDKNVITGKGDAFVDFAIELCDYFNGFENEEEKKKYTACIKGC